MVCNFHTQRFFHRFFDFLDAGVAELKHFARFDVNKMVVLFVLERLFELGTIGAELVFGHKVAVKQQVNRVVQCGAAHPLLIVFHLDIQRLDVKMPFGGVNFFQDRESFRRLAVPCFFQIIGKNLPDRLESKFFCIG
jgi:hypothetical protein